MPQGVWLIALGASALALFTTARWGIGITTDSAAYFAMARSLLTEGTVGSVVHWPPGYPATLALFGATFDAARWVNIVLIAANVLLLAACVLQAGGPRWAAIAAACYAVIGRDFIQAHISAMSEPLALAGGMGALLLAARGLERDSKRCLLAGAAIAGLTVLVRYAALIYPVTIATGALLWPAWPIRRRIRAACISAAVGYSPMLLWAIRNMLVTGTPGRNLATHLISSESILGGLDVASGWLLPMGHAPVLRWILGSAVIVGLGVLVTSVLIARRHSAMSLLAGIFIAMYLPFLVVVISFVDATTPLSGRILLPALALALVLILARAPERMTLWIAGALFVVGIQQARYTAPWIEQSRTQGVYYDGPSWRDSALLSRIRGLPGGVTLYSNGADVIRLLTPRHALDLPSTFDAATRRRNPAFQREAAALQVGGYVAYFDRLLWRHYIPDITALETQLQLRLVTKTPDGVLYEISGRAQSLATRPSRLPGSVHRTTERDPIR